ncbi:hypothetical protein [Roseateles sp. P5_E11]
MGLLDGLLGGSMDDPRTTATMQLAQGLLSAPRGMQGLAGGLLGYQQAMQQAKQDKARQEMQALQMQHQQMQIQQAQRAMQRQNSMEALPEQFMGRAAKPETMDNRDVGQPGEQRMQQGPFDLAGYAQALYKFDPHQALALQASLRKDSTPIKLGAGEALIDPTTLKPLASNPKDDAPSAIKEYNLAVQQGEKRNFTDWQAAMKRAGATNLNVNTAKPLLNTVAEGLGKQLDAGLENAKAAQASIRTAHTLKEAVDSGKVISGPGATFRVAGLQLGQVLGIGGKDSAETLGKTRQAIQSMAQAELDASAQMKGQGQITESERGLIKRAAAGDIDGLTAPEIRQLADVMERSARYKIAAHRSNVDRLKNMPDAAPVMPFYQVDEPAAYSAPKGVGGVRRYNPATGTIE